MTADEIDDCYADDYAALEDCMARAARPREGYWRPISTLAWIATRDDKVLAGTQLYEEEGHAEVGAGHSGAVWMVVGCWLGKTYGRTLRDTLPDLVEMLEAGVITARATNAITRTAGSVERGDWTDSKLAHGLRGMELIPGFVKFQFPSDQVRAAFPASERVARLDNTPQPASLPTDDLPNWAKRKPTKQQGLLFTFFGNAANHMPGGKCWTTALALRVFYVAWCDQQRRLDQAKNGADARRKKLTQPLGRTAFEEWLERYRVGWRYPDKENKQWHRVSA